MFLNSKNKNSRLFKFKFKYREDDFVLGILPFILLFFLNKCNTTIHYLSFFLTQFIGIEKH